MRIPTATITLLSLLLTFLSAGAAPSDTHVTYAPADTAALQLGEVSVTSIKQSSSLLRQPVTVTTVNQGQIERFNIAGMKGVSEIAPNFFMPDYGSRMTSSIYVRGIGARIDQSAVGLNIDNIPYLNKTALTSTCSTSSASKCSADRSRPSTAATPSPDSSTSTPSRPCHGKACASWPRGVPAAGRAGIGIYQKLAPRLAMSLNGYVSHTHGYFRNLHNGKLADASTDFSGRWKTHWRPTDRLSFENVLSAGHSRQSGYPYAYVETGDINYNDTCFYRRTSVTDGLTVRWAGPSVSIASITGLQFLSDNMTLDQDFLPESYFTLTQRQLDRSITQDIVVRGHKGGYSWLAGAFAFYKYGSMTAPVTFKEDGIENLILSNIRDNMPSFIQLGWADDNFLLGSDFRHHVSGAALYHQSTYDLGPWSFALNMRFDYEHTALSYRSNCTTGAVGSVNLPQLPAPSPSHSRPTSTRPDASSRHSASFCPNSASPTISATRQYFSRSPKATSRADSTPRCSATFSSSR